MTDQSLEQTRLTGSEKLFSTPPEGRFDIDLDFARLTEISTAYSDGFKAAADRVVEAVQAMSDHTYLGDYVFPVAYLYRHYLELQLKNIIHLAERLGYLPKTDRKGHHLKVLWEEVRTVLSMTGALGDVETGGVEAILLEVHRVDESGQEFRYPTALDGSGTLKKAPQKISLVHMRDTMKVVHEVLADVYLDLVAEFDGHIPSRKKESS